MSVIIAHSTSQAVSPSVSLHSFFINYSLTFILLQQISSSSIFLYFQQRSLSKYNSLPFNGISVFEGVWIFQPSLWVRQFQLHVPFYQRVAPSLVITAVAFSCIFPSPPPPLLITCHSVQKPGKKHSETTLVLTTVGDPLHVCCRYNHCVPPP